jgi:hypothetical protein
MILHFPDRQYIKAALLIMGVSLLLGVLGYHLTEGLSWIDSLLNASMILGGMGPVDTLHNPAAKLFASFYALYSCFMVLSIISILMAPIMHGVLKRYHSDPKNK